jgi:hypothetical protein
MIAAACGSRLRTTNPTGALSVTPASRSTEAMASAYSVMSSPEYQRPSNSMHGRSP